MNGIKHFFILVFSTCFIYGCGGGGDSDENSAPPSEVQPNTSIPISKATINKKYSGKRTAAKINELNLQPVANDILYWKDFLRILVNEPSGLEHPDNLALDIPNTTDQVCQSGSIDEPELDDIKLIKPEYTVTYSNCVIGSLMANGKVTFRVIGSDITKGDIDYFQIEMDESFSIYDSKLNHSFTITGFFQQAALSNLFTINLEVSNEAGSKLLIEDGLIDANNNIKSGRMYFAEYGYLDLKSDNIYQGENWISIKRDRRFTSEGFKNHLSITYEPIDGVARYGLIMKKIDPYVVNNLLVNYENFSSSATNIDLGPTKLKFLGQNIIYEEDSIDLNIYDNESPDFNFVTVSWQIKDENNTVIFESDNISEEYKFSTSGIYNVTLFVKDSFANVSRYSENVHVLLKDDSLDLDTNINVTSELSTNSDYQAKIDVSDSNHHYSIAYGPEGLTIDSDGNILWNGTPENHLLANEINYGVRVTDEESGKSTILNTSINITPEEVTVKSYNQFNSNYFDSSIHLIKAIDDNNDLVVLSYSYDGNYKVIGLIDGLLQVEQHYLPLSPEQALRDIHYSPELEEFDFLIREVSSLTSENPNKKFYRYSNLDNIIEEETGPVIYGNSQYLLPLAGESDLEFFDPNFDQISMCDFFPGGKKEILSSDTNGTIDDASLHYWQDGIKNQLTLSGKIYEFIDSNYNEQCEYILGYSHVFVNNEAQTLIEKFQWSNNALEKLAPDLFIKAQPFFHSNGPQVTHPESGYGGILFNEFINNDTSQWVHIGLDNLGAFVTSNINSNANLGIHLSPKNSQLRASLDIDNDNKNEWIFMHKITENDPIYEKLGYHNEHNRAHSVIVAAKLEDNKLEPIYTSAIAVDNASSLSTFSNGDLVFGNGKLPIVMDSATQFKKGFGNSDISNNQAYYAFEDGRYYQLKDSTLSFFDHNLNEIWSFAISEHITDIVNIHSLNNITVHDTYNDNIDFITLNDHWIILNRDTGKVVGQQISNLDNFSLHPNFSTNGFVFLSPPHHEFSETSDESNQSLNISGVYVVNDENISLKYNWRESVFSKVNVRIHSFSWVDVDNDAEMEIVAYFSKRLDSNDNYYYYFADIEGGQVTVAKIPIEDKNNHEYLFRRVQSNNNRCYEPSCKVVLQSSAGNILAIDKLTGIKLWQLEFESSLYNPWIGKTGEISFDTIGSNERYNANFLFQ
jgi:hypothetical protein